MYKIKEEVKKSKRPQKFEDDFGEHIYLRRKMYQFAELIGIFERHELFGNKGSSFYHKLRDFGDLRNRVHIENYHGKFDRKENKVFTSQRLTDLEATFSELWAKMVSDYKRPWNEVSEDVSDG